MGLPGQKHCMHNIQFIAGGGVYFCVNSMAENSEACTWTSPDSTVINHTAEIIKAFESVGTSSGPEMRV